jgi:thioredoxin 1
MKRKKASFKDIIRSSDKVLVDFHAEWCGPCKMMKPILKELKQKVGDGVRIVKVDVDKNQALAQKYQVRGVPTLILFKDGKNVWQQSGVVSADALQQVISQN